MPAPTPGYVKNMIRRSLREIIDPSPSKSDERKIWKFFNSECTYCGKKMRKENKEGHIDHLISCSKGGSNQITNRVLSCASCNEKEKLDMPWEEFLAQKNPDKNILTKRKEKILAWQRSHKQTRFNKKILERIESISSEVVTYYDEKVRYARGLRNKDI